MACARSGTWWTDSGKMPGFTRRRGMPWREKSIVSERQEFVTLAAAPGTNVRELCRRFGVSPTTAYKWIGRHRASGVAALHDRSRRPLASPGQTSPRVERAVLELRARHPAWGGRKLRARLLALGLEPAPAASTITAILSRHGLIDAERSA